MTEARAVLRANIVRTLRGFSLSASFEMRREVLVLFGPSGSGKSLTLRALAGVDRPQDGRIVLGTPDSGSLAMSHSPWPSSRTSACARTLPTDFGASHPKHSSGLLCTCLR